MIPISPVLPLLENEEVSSGVQNKVINLLNDELADLEHPRELQKVVKAAILDQFVINIRIKIENKYRGIWKCDSQQFRRIKNHEFDALDCACGLVERAVVCDIYGVGKLGIFVELDDAAVPVRQSEPGIQRRITLQLLRKAYVYRGYVFEKVNLLTLFTAKDVEGFVALFREVMLDQSLFVREHLWIGHFLKDQDSFVTISVEADDLGVDLCLLMSI